MYTGILLRGDSHTNYQTSVLVDREAAISEKGVGFGIDRGSGVETFWLNYEALANIGKIAADGSVTAGFKTSDLAITFDNGNIIEDINGVKVAGDNLLHKSLSYIASVSSTSIVFTDKGGTPVLTQVNIAPLGILTDQSVALSNPTTTSVDTNTDGTIVEAEDGTIIGTGDTGTITLSPAQTSAARIYAYTQDTHKNKSMRTSILIP